MNSEQLINDLIKEDNTSTIGDYIELRNEIKSIEDSHPKPATLELLNASQIINRIDNILKETA